MHVQIFGNRGKSRARNNHGDRYLEATLAHSNCRCNTCNMQPAAFCSPSTAGLLNQRSQREERNRGRGRSKPKQIPRSPAPAHAHRLLAACAAVLGVAALAVPLGVGALAVPLGIAPRALVGADAVAPPHACVGR
eukprot:7180877-Alexandrium_andersonii.AAC.1